MKLCEILNKTRSCFTRIDTETQVRKTPRTARAETRAHAQEQTQQEAGDGFPEAPTGEMVDCPLCGVKFHEDVIAGHAATCDGPREPEERRTRSNRQVMRLNKEMGMVLDEI